MVKREFYRVLREISSNSTAMIAVIIVLTLFVIALVLLATARIENQKIERRRLAAQRMNDAVIEFLNVILQDKISSEARENAKTALYRQFAIVRDIAISTKDDELLQRCTEQLTQIKMLISIKERNNAPRAGL